MENHIKAVLTSVQESSSNHQKNLKVLENIYNKNDPEDFAKAFVKYILSVFHVEVTVKNPYVEKVLDFCAKFVSNITKNNETESQLEEDAPSDPFLTYVIEKTLNYHDLIYIPARYHSCRFITLILHHLGNDSHMDNDLCDLIQNAMLERVHDIKASVRLQAVMALTRLQEPLNLDCPVVKAYISLFYDVNALVRREVVRKVAPNVMTVLKIKDRVRDIDPNVRIAAYIRCADLGPCAFKITDRQQILISGFYDTNKNVKHVFTENLLPKWLSAYKGDFLSFLSALKIDAEESDIMNTEEICKKVMEVFFRTMPIRDIINALPLDGDKLIPVNNANFEVVTYWSILSSYLQKGEETEEFLEEIIPELTPFCNYIEAFVKLKTNKNMEEWEYLDYQYILTHLFAMAEQYDLSDEVGRKTLKNLITWLLQNHRLQYRLLCKVVSISERLSSNINTFSNEICHIMSDIREPLIENEPAPQEIREKGFQVARLEVKINVLEGELEDAIECQDFQKASILKNEIIDFKRELEDLTKPIPSQPEKVSVSKDDPETVCWCLDILAALLQLPSVKEIYPALRSCKNEFLMPLITSTSSEVNWRVMRCLSLYCLLEKDVAVENAKVICIPIATYRAIPNYNKHALSVSVSAVSDLIRVYGPGLFGVDDDDNCSINNTTTNSHRRKLYHDDDMADLGKINNRLTLEFIIEIILDMVDDENEEIREVALTAVAKLILDEFPVNPMLICRLLLKWYNPVTEKSGDRLQQKLGAIIETYAKTVKNSKQVIEKAVIPILTSIASAPRTSPLADIDVDNLIKLLAAITNTNGMSDIVNVHCSLAHTICSKIARKSNDNVVPYLSKMLNQLDISSENDRTRSELITQADLLLQEEYDLDKMSRKNIMKFIEKLRNQVNETNTTNATTDNTVIQNKLDTIKETPEDNENRSTTNEFVEKTSTSEEEETQPRKRRKNNGCHPEKSSEKENYQRRVTRGSLSDTAQSDHNFSKDLVPICESTRTNANITSNANGTTGKTTAMLKDMVISELQQVKRKKLRSKNGLSSEDKLKKEIKSKKEESFKISRIDDDNTMIKSPSSNSSGSVKKHTIIEQTSSDSESSVSSLRRSTRKIKKKNPKGYI